VARRVKVLPAVLPAIERGDARAAALDSVGRLRDRPASEKQPCVLER